VVGILRAGCVEARGARSGREREESGRNLLVLQDGVLGNAVGAGAVDLDLLQTVPQEDREVEVLRLGELGRARLDEPEQQMQLGTLLEVHVADLSPNATVDVLGYVVRRVLVVTHHDDQIKHLCIGLSGVVITHGWRCMDVGALPEQIRVGQRAQVQARNVSTHNHKPKKKKKKNGQNIARDDGMSRITT